MALDNAGGHVSQWEAIRSIAAKIGCTSETLRLSIRQVEGDSGARPCVIGEERERAKALECQNREFRQANEILRKALT